MLLWGFGAVFCQLLTASYSDSSLVQAAKFEDDALAALVEQGTDPRQVELDASRCHP